MSKYIPGNQKHLCLEDRIYIENKLNEGASFKDIAKYLCKDPTTISKEVKKRSDYIFLKDTFTSLNPEGGTFVSDKLEQASDMGMIDKKTYAYGGVNIENIKLAKELGFGGVVVDDDLWDKFDIHHQLDYKELISHYERLAKAVKA